MNTHLSILNFSFPSVTLVLFFVLSVGVSNRSTVYKDTNAKKKGEVSQWNEQMHIHLKRQSGPMVSAPDSGDAHLNWDSSPVDLISVFGLMGY